MTPAHEPVFTDEDLARIKRDLNGYRQWASNDQVLALLARLEAAEWALLCFRIIPDDILTQVIRDAVSDWYKKAGKD